MREVAASAPGRVNLIGEHTDYHEGFVLPCAVPQRTEARVQVRDDMNVVVASSTVMSSVEYRLGGEQAVHSWSDYVQGVTWVLREHGIRGFNMWLDSNVPLGSGLSSSAALEVAMLRTLRIAFDLPFDDVQLARLAQKAEVEFVGAPVGIMDQMASSLAAERSALFLDTRSLTFEQIRLPDQLELAVIDSGLAHQHAGGDYVTRRRESEEAAQRLGVRCLRDAPDDAIERLNEMPPLLARRARHIITENARVLRARDVLRGGHLEQLGQLFSESHASMRDDYEISVPEVDLLVAIAERQRGAYGARLTGGGFGGAIVVAAAAGEAARIGADTASAFARQTNRRATVLVPLP